LHQPTLAEPILHQALEQSAKTSRRRALILTDLALSALQHAEVEKACAYTEQVIPLAVESASGFLRNRLAQVQQQLIPFASVEAVQLLQHRLTTLSERKE
jgi:hypothetical protein